MNRCRTAFALLWLASAVPAVAEPAYPPPAAFVASIELSIELCSQRNPTLRGKYSALREIVNAVFSKRNYASYVGTAAYREAYAELQQQQHSVSEEDLANYCASVLRLHESPPKGIVYFE